jgi:tRNA U38,U39,U40 pseudouridine synthase TruA
MLGKSDVGATKRKSHWTLQFHRTYPGLKFNKDLISKRTGISKSTLNTVYNRGLKAWKMGGSRPGATAQQWAISRTYKYILVSKKKAPKAWYATRPDPDQNLRNASRR